MSAKSTSARTVKPLPLRVSVARAKKAAAAKGIVAPTTPGPLKGTNGIGKVARAAAKAEEAKRQAKLAARRARRQARKANVKAELVSEANMLDGTAHTIDRDTLLFNISISHVGTRNFVLVNDKTRMVIGLRSTNEPLRFATRKLAVQFLRRVRKES